MTDENPDRLSEGSKSGVVASANLDVQTRVYLSHTHIRAASFFAREAGKLEDEQNNFDTDLLNREQLHEIYVSSSLVSSALFLEATVNEFYSDITHDFVRERKYDLPEQLVQRVDSMVGSIKGTTFTDISTLDKFQWLLILAGRNPFDKGRVPYQDTQIVMNFRSAFVHYEPEDLLVSSTERDPETHSLEDALRTKQVSLNPIVGEGVPSFPAKCMSHDCAMWAAKSVIEFTDEFFYRLDLEPPYDHIRPDFSTNSI